MDEGNDSETIQEYVTPLAGDEPGTDGASLAPVAEALADARIIGMGEATHGTHEFFQLKDRLFRRLVTDHGVRLFGLEANFPETLAIDEYVRTGEGDPEAALQGIYFWTWNTQELLDVVEWARSFNEGREPADQIRFYGVDAQFALGAAERLAAFLERTELDPSVEETLGMLADGGLHTDDEEQFAARVAETENLVAELRQRLDADRGALAEATSDRAVALAERYVATIDAALDRQQVESFGVDAFEARDKAMAENVSWILDHEPHDCLVLWGHNGHVRRGRTELDDGDARTLGSFLDAEFGDDYAALGFEFGSGTFQAMVADGDGRALRECRIDGPPEGSVAERLSSADGDPLFLNVAAAAEDQQLSALLREERPFHSIGANFDPEATQTTGLTLGDAFDALVYVEQSSRAVPLGES